MAEVTIGRVRIGWKGNWDSLASYTALDAVAHNGESWVARVDVPVGIEPSDLNPEFWQIIARKGADGVDGG